MIAFIALTLISVSDPISCPPLPKSVLANPFLAPDIGETDVPRNTFIWVWQPNEVLEEINTLTDEDTGQQYMAERRSFPTSSGQLFAVRPVGGQLEPNKRYRIRIFENVIADFTTSDSFDSTPPPPPSIVSTETFSAKDDEYCSSPEMRLTLDGLEAKAIALPKLIYEGTLGSIPFYATAERMPELMMSIPRDEDEMQVEVTAHDLAGNVSSSVVQDFLGPDGKGFCTCVAARSSGSAGAGLLFGLAILLVFARRKING